MVVPFTFMIVQNKQISYLINFKIKGEIFEMKDLKKEIKRKLKILDHILEVTRPSTYYMLKTYELADISKSDEEGWDLQWWDLDEYTKEIVGNIEDARYDALLDERKKLLNLLDRLE